ncbi:MAG: tRNA pseudouridine(38-40) synthase TruA [Sphaerochaetaceae bacterium]
MARSDWRRPVLVPLTPGMRRIRMTISYDGSRYRGWQSQRNGTSVQQKVEEALSSMLGETVAVHGSGRTDSGVHAIGQVCHFDIVSKLPVRAFKPRLNSLLPSDIRIMDAGETDGTFHARFTSMAREYTYLIKRAEELTAFDSGHVWAVRELPPEELLNEYATVIAGTHDFTTFCSSKDECSSKMRDIYESVWTMGKDVFGYDLLRYRITGNAFLYHMVRSLVGTMVEFAACGKGAASFRAALEAKDRRACGRTASPYGLYLTRISYDPEEYQWFEEANENG